MKIAMNGRLGLAKARLLLAALTALVVAGCVRLPSPGEAPRLYALAPKIAHAAAHRPVPWQLVVDMPSAPAALDTDHIALRPTPLEIEYYGHARWADPAPRMVQRLLIKGFEQSGDIVGVGASGMGLRADYELQSELWDFTASYRRAGGAPTVRVRLVAKMVRESDAEIVATRSFVASVPAASDTMNGVTEAFDRALGQVIGAVVPWALAVPAGHRAGQ